MKAGWQKKKLSQVCELINGRAYRKPELLSEGKYRVLRVGNFFTNENWYYSDLELEDNKYCDHGDLLYAWSASFGPRIWAGEKVIFHYHIWKVKHDLEQIEQQFLFYFFEWDKELLKLEKGAGTTMIHVSKGSMEERDILVPPLPEQQRIVAILDEAFEAIAAARANAEQNRQNARALFESYLQSVFSQRGEGWVEKRLDEICQFSSGGTPSKANAAFWSGDIPWISGRDMKSTRLFDSLLHVSESAVAESSTRMAPVGALLVLVRGMGLAHGAQIGELMVPCSFNQDIRAIHPIPELVSRFLLFALRNRINASDTVLSNAAHGTLKIDSQELHRVMIPVPTREQQERIVRVIDTIAEETQRLESLYQRKIEALDELKQSLLQQAFSGNL